MFFKINSFVHQKDRNRHQTKNGISFQIDIQLVDFKNDI